MRIGEADNYRDWLEHRKTIGKMPSHVVKQEPSDDMMQLETWSQDEGERRRKNIVNILKNKMKPLQRLKVKQCVK